MHQLRLFGRTVHAAAVLGVGLVALLALPAQAAVARGSFHQTNLVSDIPGMAAITDPNLVNPWGLSSSATSPIWVANNGTNTSTLYNTADQKVPLVVAVAGRPTGTVFNASGDFAVTNGTVSAPSRFLFVTEDGTVLGWNPAVSAAAVIAVDNSASGAIYKGLTNGSVGTSNFLYAANFHAGRVDVFDRQFHQVTLAGNFTDPSLPSGFAPFGIQNIGGWIYVAYAMQDADAEDEIAGPGLGFVAVYSTDGVFARRFASGGTLNAPWGLSAAPANFGNFHDTILVGNFGDGRINAYGPDGRFRGQLKSETSAPIEIEGLWGLRVGNGGNGGTTDALYFSAGIDDEAHGLYGKIQNVPD
ncbi:MAG TPA: TIGR03118 family protein [Candidatus Dormibacteraeota bacterium]